MNTPYYVPYIDRFRSNIEKFRSEVVSIYPNYKYAYSLKTNSYKPFCEQAKKTLSMAEVVSPYELKLALSTGFEYKDIIYNGVIPDFVNKLKIAKAGGIVNLESESEIIDFAEYSNNNKEFVNIGVRLNIADYLGVESRFGISPYSSFYSFLLNNFAHPYLAINSVHCHIHGARQLDKFEKRIDVMAKCAKELGASIIDIGGNMYGNIDKDFRQQYKEYVPTASEYAHCIGERMRNHFPDFSKTLINEGGTLIVSDCMDLVTKVLNVKKRNGQTYIIVDTKPMDIGFVCGNKNPSIESACQYDNGSVFVKEAVVEGCACMEDNYIGTFTGNVKIGDLLVIKNIGAYSYSVRNNFITESCSVKLS